MPNHLSLGLWAPLPHTLRPEPEMTAAIAALQAPGEIGQMDQSYAMALRLIQRAEALGFEVSLIAERFLGPDLESWALASAIAAQTSKIEIIAAVHPGVITPQVTAKLCTTLDRISGGRFILNVVNGWWKEEFDLFSGGAWLEDGDARYRRMDEFIEVLKRLCAGERFGFEGEFYSFENAHLPTRMMRPSLPIYTASRADPGKDTIARHGDLWFVDYPPGYHNFDDTLAMITGDIADMKGRAARHGRTLKFGMSAHVITAATDAEAERLAAEMVAEGKANPVAALPARALGACLVGTPERVADRLRRYNAVGLDTVMLHFHPMESGLERFAAEVKPLLQ